MRRLAKFFVLLLPLTGWGVWGGDAMAAVCSSAVSGNWNAAATWTAGSACTIAGGNATDGPGADDDVTINSPHTVTLTAAAQARNFTVAAGGQLTTGSFGLTIQNNGVVQIDGVIQGNGAAASLFTKTGTGGLSGTGSVNNTQQFNINGNTTIAAGTSLTFTGAECRLALAAGVTVINNGTVTFAPAATCATARTLTLTATSVWTNNGTVTAGTVTGASGALWTNAANSVLNAGAAFFTTAGTVLTATAVPNTVNYNGAAQTAKVTTYNNLTLSGSGAKTFATTPTVNSVLSMEGTATVTVSTGVVTYGANATLQYNTATARTVSSEEWITPFAASGGVIIANTGVITLNAAKVFNASVPLTINSGAALATNNFQLTLGGDFVNSGGTFTAGSSPIVIANTMAVQSIAGFTTTGLVSMTKTAGVATFTGNVGGAGLTINGAGGTLNLGAGRTHTFTGTWTRTAGTLDGGSSLLRVGLSCSGAGGTFTASTGTVEWNRAGIQTVCPVSYNHLILSGSGAKTMTSVTTIAGDLSVSGAATMTSNAAFTVTGALNYSSSGTTTLTAATPISIGTFNQSAGTITDNANTITVTGTGAGTWTKSAGTFTATGTVEFTGAAPQIGASNFNNLTINVGSGTATLTGNASVAGNLNVASTGTLDLATFTANRASAGGTITVGSGATLKIGGTNGFPTNYSTHALDASSTVEYNGTNQAVGSVTAPGYGNLTISGSGTKTAVGNVTVVGTLTLTSSTFAVDTGTLALNGPAIAGTSTNLSTTASSSISLGGSATGIFLPSSVLLLNNLTVNNANGVTLNSGPTVSGTLALTSGIVDAGGYTLRSSANCTTGVTVGTGYVKGNVELTFPGGNVTCRFPVGSTAAYAPIDLTTPVGSVLGKMTGSTTGNEHPDVSNSPVDPAIDVNRFWTLSGDTIGSSPYVVTFNFVAGDVDAGADPLGFVLGRKPSGAWSEPASPTPSSLAITASLTGPIVGTTDFVAGARAFICSIPSGSPVGTTCVCDNFNRATINPSTIYGGNWTTNSVSGSFGLPRIINNRLRLTDNTPNVSTAATAPGTFPARGNWVSAEFKHYAYSSRTSRAGTITTSTASPTVNGVGTAFTTALQNGYALYRATDGAYIGTVLSRTSATVLTLTANALSTNAGIAYHSSGTGADGIAMTLSDAAQTATPGAFGGSLGYAPKCENGVLGCVSDCSVPGGCPGFNYGWVGIAVDEYGNFSSNTEGRTGGSPPGVTVDSVAVRGSGSGQTGYPYLAGTATLAPQIDNTISATASPGYNYRLMVDARGYTYHPTLNPGGVKSALVSVSRDTSGTGTSYSSLFTTFDAYLLNPSQADVPDNWQVSFTGSTGGANNIHEIIGLKICAQTIVPPAGYRIQVDNLTPTTCPSDPQPTVTISPLNANGQVITNYINTVTLSATLFGGGPSSATWVSQGTNLGTWDSANKRYTFVLGDNGVAKFTLSDLVQENVYITVTEFTAPGTLTSTLAQPVQFSSGAASFVVSTPDTLGTGVVAGRAHLMRVTRNTVGCGGGTDVGFKGVKPIDGWYNPAAGDHPAGALAPQVCAPVSGACLPTYGACQTLSIAPPVVDSASNNLSLTFVNGVADFCLITTDVGKYSVGLRDDSVGTGTPPVTGTSVTLTARPFAVAVKDVTGNPAVNTSTGTVFTTAGTSFPATVAGYLWSSTGTGNAGWGDADGNGLPDVATLAQLSTGGIAPHFAGTVTLAADTSVAANYAPVAPPATQGSLSGGSVTVTAGSGTSSTLNYDEVGSFTLKATAATAYLNTSGVDLNPRVAIFAGPANSRDSWVGRFKPHKFSVTGSLVTRSDLQSTEAQATPFTYMEEPIKVSLTITAQNLGGGTTQNYSDSTGYSKLDAAALGTGANWFNTGCTATTKCMGLGAVDGTGLTDRLSIVGSGTYALVGNPTISWASGIGTVTAHLKLARGASPDGPFETLKIGAMPRDEEGVTVPTASLDLDAATNDSAPFGNPNPPVERKLIATAKVRFGRLWLGSACGSDKRDLTIPFRAEYWNGNVFITNTDDSLTSIAKANIGLGNHQPAGFNISVDRTHIPAGPFSVVNGLGSFSLAKPTGTPAAGSVDVVFGLGSTTATNTSFDFSAAQPPTAGANMPYLRGKWYDSVYDRDPVARAAFGIFCGSSGSGPSRGPIYIRESY